MEEKEESELRAITERRPKWTHEKSNSDSKESGEQIRKRILRNKKTVKERFGRKGGEASRGKDSNQWKALAARIREKGRGLQTRTRDKRS